MKQRRPSLTKPTRTARAGSRPSASAALSNDDKFKAALALHQQGQLDQPEAVYREILQSEPAHFDALRMLATVEAERKHSVVALELFDQVLRISPDHASSLNHRGNALLDLKRHDEALSSYDHALRIEPDYAEVLFNRGNALLDMKCPADALASYDRALAIDPDYVDVLYNRGSALRDLARYEESLASYDRALAVKPDHAEALCNRGNTLLELNRHEEALQSYDRALAITPDSADVHMNRAIVWLTLGDFRRGWPEHEWRWKYAGLSLPSIEKPLWAGEPLNGRTILLHWEQGFGDTIHFVRYARLLQRQGARVVVSCQAPLVPLLRRCEGIDQLVAHGDPLPDFDVWTPMLSMHGLLPVDEESIPGECGYVTADPALVAHWKTRLADYPGFRIAIAWQGNRGHQGDRHRSIPLKFFGRLAKVSGVRLISLQTEEGIEPSATMDGSFEVIRFPDLDTTNGPFMDTAAILRNVDLTICCDTSVLHLAGALGVPVWLAQMFSSDWRWLLDREDSAWYPSLRLFRQKSLGNWDEVFQRMARAVRAITNTRKGQDAVRKAATIAVEISPGELIDKITILEIKAERLADGRRVDRQDREIKTARIPESDKLHNVRAELATHEHVRDRAIPPSAELAALTSELKLVNDTLWQIEDHLRDAERVKEFGAAFVELARSVYKTNDRRSALKKQINELLGSRLQEEKLYSSY